MSVSTGAGCWPGRAGGIVQWLPRSEQREQRLADNRPGEVLRFRAEVSRALESLEGWTGQQRDVGGSLLLQGYREALLEAAWTQRACLLIDRDGLSAGSAAVEAARQVAVVLARSEELRERAERLHEVGRWLAARCEPAHWPAGTVLAAVSFSPLELLDRQHPALMASPEPPPVAGEGPPLVWGVPALGPDWHGHRVTIDGRQVTLDRQDARWWPLTQDQLGGHQLCRLNGSPEAIERMARKTGRPPVALIERLDDLAAVPLFIHQVLGVALDLDRLGPAPRLKHPGFLRLVADAAEAARAAGLPLLAGGEPAVKQPDYWIGLGCTALYKKAIPRGGQRVDVIRREQKSGM